MRHLFKSSSAVVVLIIVGASDRGWGQTTDVTGANLAIKSSGGAVLTENGYVGTYITLAAPATVGLTLTASGTTTDGVAPQMSLVVDDTRIAWGVATGSATYSTSVTLPAGTHFVRTEFTNEIAGGGHTLSIQNLRVTGAAVSNSNSNTNALAAADTYIGNYRKGDASVQLQGVAAGTQVQVKLVNHAFKFGTEVPGFSTASSVNTLLGNNPTQGSTAANYQQRLLQNFNSVTPANAGKWDSNEFNKDNVTMGGVDRIFQYAEANNLRVRQHNLIWGSQQPAYVNTLLTAAAGGDAAAKAALTTEVQQRIGYYVNARARRYAQLDVYNESVHTPQYWNVYGGAPGIAEIYNSVAGALPSGSAVGLFTNEYNVLSDSNVQLANGSFAADRFANWYRDHVEQISAAGGRVDGVGVQYYAHEVVGTDNNSRHNAARLYGALNNLTIGGRALELTEFGIKNDGVGTDAQDRQTDAQILGETMKLVFGTPGATGFTMWGFWAGDVWDQAPNAALYDLNWNLTPAGEVYRDLMTLDGDSDLTDDWTTDLTAVVDANGRVNFSGFYGDYQILAGNQTYAYSLVKAVPEPQAAVGLMMVGGAVLLCRGRR